MARDPAGERDVEHRFARRTGRRIAVGGMLGTVAGAIAGLLIGAVVFDPWSAGHWAIVLAIAILGGGIAMVQGGLAGLEPVHPGREPTLSGEPLRDDEGWTSPEHDERSA